MPQQYQVELKPKAAKDLKSLPKADQAKVAIRLSYSSQEGSLPLKSQ